MNRISDNASFLITGATGLIGQSLTRLLLDRFPGGSVIAVTRSREKAERVFSDCLSPRLHILEADVTQPLTHIEKVDYIVHGASITSSRAFVEKPVETATLALRGTQNLLDFARFCGVKGFVYLSSMEVYGTPSTDEPIHEDHASDLNTMSVRASYPESKRMCESLCASYASEYGVPASVLRLTQTFGPGVEYDDGRVFAEFARCVIENRKIVLHTAGATKRSYLFTEDAAEAILTLLARGKPGEAYNAANPATYCSVLEMAHFVAEFCGKGKIPVIVEKRDDYEAFGYAPVLRMNLNTRKLNELGWEPHADLSVMFSRLIEDMRSKRKEGDNAR